MGITEINRTPLHIHGFISLNCCRLEPLIRVLIEASSGCAVWEAGGSTGAGDGGLEAVMVVVVRRGRSVLPLVRWAAVLPSFFLLSSLLHLFPLFRQATATVTVEFLTVATGTRKLSCSSVPTGDRWSGCWNFDRGHGYS